MTMTRITLTTSAVFGEEDTAALGEYMSDALRAFTRTALGDATAHSVASEVKLLERKFKIYYDPHAEDPCSEEDVSPFIFYFAHRRYKGGHKNAVSPWLNDDPHCGEFIPGVVECLTVYGYDHGGLTISTTPFQYRWDSGIIGAIYITQESLKASGVTFDCPGDMRESMKKFIEYYDQYMQGNCYVVAEFDELGNQVETICGFIGDDIEKNGILDNFPVEDHPALRKAFDNIQI